jgi:hypothetical protein
MILRHDDMDIYFRAAVFPHRFFRTAPLAPAANLSRDLPAFSYSLIHRGVMPKPGPRLAGG